MGHPLLNRWEPRKQVDVVEEEPRTPADPSDESADLLFEIGTEEIPAGYLDSASAQLRTIASKALVEHRLSFEEVRTLATPRRLTLYVKRLATTQGDNVSEVVGPPKRVAYDENGFQRKPQSGLPKRKKLISRI